MTETTPAVGGGSYETEAGFTITSNQTSSEELERVLKPIPPNAKPGDKKAGDFKTKHVDEKGQVRGEAGKFEARQPAKEEPEGDDSADEDTSAKLDAKPDEKPHKERAKQRIEQLAREKREVADRADKAERELAAEREARRKIEEKLIKPEPEKAAPREAKPAEGDDPEPSEETFNGTYSEWVKAHNKWAARDALREHDRKAEMESSEQRRSQGIAKVTEIVGEAFEKAGGKEFIASLSEEVRRELVPHFALTDPSKAGPLNALASEISLMGEKAPQFYKYLSDNPEVLDRFRKVANPEQLNREFGKLEVAVEGSAIADTPEPTPAAFEPRARPPVRSVAGSPHTADPDPSRAKSFDEYVGMVDPRRRPRL